MHRSFLILSILGILTACGRSTPAAQAPQVVEVTKVTTVEVTRVVTSVVIVTPTLPSAEPTGEPTPESSATMQPVEEVVTPSIVAPTESLGNTLNYPMASVINGGNLRTETTVSANTVIGQVCPGDQVAVVTQQAVGAVLWYKVQITTTVADCDPNRVAVGTEGWLSSSLVSEPSMAVANAPTAPPVSSAPSPTTNTLPEAVTAPPFQEIRDQMLAMTDAQWNIYSKSLRGKQVVQWKGWVDEVNEKLLGGYDVLIDMDPPDALSVYDVSFSIPEDLALRLQKGQVVTFSGTIHSASNILGSLAISLDPGTIE